MSAAHPATAPPAPACYLPSLQQNAPAIPAIALSTKLGHKTTHVVTEELKTGSLGARSWMSAGLGPAGIRGHGPPATWQNADGETTTGRRSEHPGGPGAADRGGRGAGRAGPFGLQRPGERRPGQRQPG